MLPVIDCDVHHTWNSEDEVLPYFPARWRELGAAGQIGILHYSGSRLLNGGGFLAYPNNGGPLRRPDFIPTDGRRPGSDYQMLKTQLLDALNVQRAVLSFDIGLQTGLHNPWLALDAVKAVNDWNVERWLSIPDDRIRSAVLVPTHMPEEGAKEIRRMAKHSKICEALLVTSALGKPFGDPVYEPIHKAAAECGLPIAIHLGGEHVGDVGHVSAGGVPGTRIEEEFTNHETAQRHVVSFIANGVFERYPQLKVILVEFSVVWLPALMRRMDSNVRVLREESPWVKRMPSEYVHSNIRVSTQPLETLTSKQFRTLIDVYPFLEDVFLFATDYPHFDADDPFYITKRLPKEWMSKLLYKNSCATYGWDESEFVAKTSVEAPVGSFR
jgi:predicted TIM-barrel fold metal-dependent hydrolase